MFPRSAERDTSCLVNEHCNSRTAFSFARPTDVLGLLPVVDGTPVELSSIGRTSGQNCTAGTLMGVS